MNQTPVAHQLLVCVQLLLLALEDFSIQMRHIEAALSEELKAGSDLSQSHVLNSAPTREAIPEPSIEICCRACGALVRQNRLGQIFNCDDDLDHAQSCSLRRAWKPQIPP